MDKISDDEWAEAWRKAGCGIKHDLWWKLVRMNLPRDEFIEMLDYCGIAWRDAGNGVIAMVDDTPEP